MPPRELNDEEALRRAKSFSERYVQRGPYEFFPEPEVVSVVQEGLAENERKHGYRYCPWMPPVGDPVEDRKKICPCDRHHEDIERDGFCLWMFFVSEEFLRKHKAGEDFDQTIDKAIPVGHELFENSEGKGKHNAKKRQDAGQDPKREPGESKKGDWSLNTQIEVFTSNGWGPCHMVKVYLSRKGVQFAEYNVSTDRDSLKRLIGMGFRSTPVTLIGDEKVVGYSPSKMDSALRSATADASQA